MSRVRMTAEMIRGLEQPAVKVASEATKAHDLPAWEELPRAAVELCSMLWVDGALHGGGSHRVTEDYADCVDDAVDGFKRFGMFDRAEKLEEIVDLAAEYEECEEGSEEADELSARIDVCVKWWWGAGFFWPLVHEMVRAEAELFAFDVEVPESLGQG